MKKVFFNYLFCCISGYSIAQSTNDFYFKSSGFTYGGAIGMSHYIGDLNPTFDAFLPGWSASIFAKKYFNNYVALRYQCTAMNFGFTDKYATNLVRQNRNLSFSTNVIELSVQGDFHFFYYSSGLRNKNFTPYLTLGLGLFYFEPYAYKNNQKYYLRSLKTEGVNYLPINVSIPVGIGIKWGLNAYMNAGIEVVNRLTFTDYLDDVSANYPSQLSDDIITNQLSNRSLGLNNTSFDLRSVQRGQNSSFDMFFTMQASLSFNVFDYFCP